MLEVKYLIKPSLLGGFHLFVYLFIACLNLHHVLCSNNKMIRIPKKKKNLVCQLHVVRHTFFFLFPFLP